MTRSIPRSHAEFIARERERAVCVCVCVRSAVTSLCESTAGDV